MLQIKLTKKIQINTVTRRFWKADRKKSKLQCKCNVWCYFYVVVAAANLPKNRKSIWPKNYTAAFSVHFEYFQFGKISGIFILLVSFGSCSEAFYLNAVALYYYDGRMFIQSVLVFVFSFFIYLCYVYEFYTPKYCTQHANTHTQMHIHAVSEAHSILSLGVNVFNACCAMLCVCTCNSNYVCIFSEISYTFGKCVLFFCMRTLWLHSLATIPIYGICVCVPTIR